MNVIVVSSMCGSAVCICYAREVFVESVCRTCIDVVVAEFVGAMHV